MFPRVAVIIPFYQTQKGLLQRAISSIAGQIISGIEFLVIVVDDSSPVPATCEIDELQIDRDVKIIVERQENGGPGAARNRGIEIALANGAGFVAFIDSDDVWSSCHIKNALTSMSREGSDWYFSDIVNDGKSSLEVWPGARKIKRNLSGREIDFINLERASAVKIIAAECWPHISSSVFHARVLIHVRFDTKFRRACEDQLFFLNAALASKVITMSIAMAGERGAGVSIYRETMAWASTNGPARMIEELSYRNMVFGDIRLPIKSKIRLLWSGVGKVTHLWFVVFWNFRHGRDMFRETLRDLMNKAPIFLFISPVSIIIMPIYVIWMKVRARSLAKGGA